VHSAGFIQEGSMRVLFKGHTYRLNELEHSINMFFCNAVNRGRLAHQGSVTKHEFMQCPTPQVYAQADGALYVATIIGKSQWVNRVYKMFAYDFIPVPVPSFSGEST
jgi:hypothetical protein